MRGRSKIVALVAAVIGVLIFAARGAALEPGVYITPGAPAAKEYSFPLSVLRAAAGGHGTIPGVVVPPFGAGITPAAGPGVHSSSGVTGSASVSHGRASASRHTRSHQAVSEPKSASGSPPALSSGAIASLIRARSSTSQEALIGVPVLLVGLALGGAIVAVRRRAGE